MEKRDKEEGFGGLIKAGYRTDPIKNRTRIKASIVCFFVRLTTEMNFEIPLSHDFN